jgi:hypothetical protein
VRHLVLSLGSLSSCIKVSIFVSAARRIWFCPLHVPFSVPLDFSQRWVGLVLPLIFSGPCLSAVWFGFSPPVALPVRQILLFGFVLGAQIDFRRRSGLRSWFPRFS